MAKVKINMPEFERYIKLMNKLVEDICETNKTFAVKILALESGWCDDVYKEARNQLMRMQAPTNKFISTLEELDEKLIDWYCDLYDQYIVNDPYTRPVISMGRVEKVDDELKRNDQLITVSLETLEEYVQSTTAYTGSITALLEEFSAIHANFAEYFQSRRYEEIDEELRKPKSEMIDILNEMDNLAAFVKSKTDIIRKFQ